MNVNILGTKYEIVEQTEFENPKLKDCNGLCETYSKVIVIRKIDSSDPLIYEDIQKYRNKVLRHEMIHAFLHESGLDNDSDWAANEEIVDWIAIQFPKMIKAFYEIAKNEENVDFDDAWEE